MFLIDFEKCQEKWSTEHNLDEQAQVQGLASYLVVFVKIHLHSHIGIVCFDFIIFHLTVCRLKMLFQSSFVLSFK